MFKAGKRNTELGQNKVCLVIYNCTVLLEYKHQKWQGPWVGRVYILKDHRYRNLKICKVLEPVCQNNKEIDFLALYKNRFH